MECYFCKKDIQITDRIGRQDSCPHCNGDLHICMNCEFYDPSAYNECRESQADRVLEKEKSNFCDYFELSTESPSPSPKGPLRGGERDGERGRDPVDVAKKKLEELFRK